MKLKMFNNSVASKAEKQNTKALAEQILDKIDEEAKTGEFEFYATIPQTVLRDIKRALTLKRYPSVIKNDARGTNKVIVVYWGPSTKKMSPYYQLNRRQWYDLKSNDGFKIFT